ncbi:MAG: hypothetical protein AAFW82_04300 [Pseudomonadota bacterium]
MKKSKIPTVKDHEVLALLAQYECPVPLHEVRTRFLGNIATPSMSAQPLDIVKDLWGGELPSFDTFEQVNELIDILINRLWNSLTQHQNRNSPVRLRRIDSQPTRECLMSISLMRCQELDGFIEGLFGRQDTLNLPERASNSLERLEELRGLFSAVEKVASDDNIEATEKQIETTLKHLRELTLKAEKEMHTIILVCVRSRKQFLSSLPKERPTFH